MYGVVQRLIPVVAEAVEKEAGGGMVARPPTACWEGEPEGSVEGHSALFSPLNPSVTCHTFVMDGERKAVEKRKGEEEGKLDI